MSQTAYNRDHAESMAGMKADAGFDRVESFSADGAVPFGRGVGYEAGNTTKVRLPAKDNAKIVFDADFVTSNTIDMDVNGTAIAQVTFTTDHDTTAGLVRDAIAAISGVSCVLDPADANNRTFLVENDDGSEITIANIVVAGGASQAGSTVTYSGDDLFRGISLQTHKEQNLSGVVQYADKESVSVARQGVFWIETAVAVTADDDAYVLYDGTGKFTNVSTNNMATGGKFRSTVGAAGLAKVEVNIP